jgi:branched-chain amino acid transport system substrate-binding protein
LNTGKYLAIKSTMKKYITISIVIILLGILSFGIAGRENTERNSIKIGALLTLSGESAVYGEGARQGIELAIEEYNASHPDKKIEIIYEDTQGEARETVSSYQKLINIDRVDGILGPLFQTQANAIAPLVGSDTVPVIAISPLSPDKRSTQRNPLAFWPDPMIEAGAMAEYVYAQGIRSIGVLGTKDSWEQEVTNGFVKKFTELGGKITVLEVVLPDANDLRLNISKIIASKPEAIYLGTYYQFIRAIKTLQSLNYKGTLFGIEVDTYLLDETKPYANGLKFVSPDLYSYGFLEKAEKRFGQKPNIPVGQAYDAANLMISILENSKSTKEAVQSLSNLETYTGVSGRVTFDKDNRSAFTTPIFEIQNGKIVKLESSK